MRPGELYIGIMSGTSLDGADAVLVELSGPPRVVAFASSPFADNLRNTLLKLHEPAGDELHTAQLAANSLAILYAETVNKLLVTAGVSAENVKAIGCHGQTLRHRPEFGYTIQLQNPALLAELTRINVVADFRSRDIAAGGQGAPLVPAFHDGVFRSASADRAIVNIGGISNITLLARETPATGFDSGPGNMLMNAWIERHMKLPFDDQGRWASSGKVIPELLDALRNEPFFKSAPPKSTGRDLFSLAWLEKRIPARCAAQDVQATLLELCAWAIADHLLRYAPTCTEVYLCGGGAKNTAARIRLQELLSHISVRRTEDLHVPGEQVEALAFAWLAQQAMQHRTIDLTLISGARHPCILGAIYPA